MPMPKKLSKKLPIAPCLPSDVVKMNLDWNWNHPNDVDDDEPYRRDASKFMLLEGQPIKWLGYSPKSSPEAEWYGGTNPNFPPAGFAGIDMHYYGRNILITFYNANDVMIGRAEVYYYKLTEEYIVYFTSLEPFTDNHGEHMGFHIYAYPDTYNRTACMFLIDNKDFALARGVKGK